MIGSYSLFDQLFFSLGCTCPNVRFYLLILPVVVDAVDVRVVDAVDVLVVDAVDVLVVDAVDVVDAVA